MSARDPISALMRRAGVRTKNELTEHPEKATVVAERFNHVAELLNSGDVVAATVAACQAQALLEVLDALGKQDKIDELRDPKGRARLDTLDKWNTVLKPSAREALSLTTHFREHRYNRFDTRPPYKAPPPAPKPPRDPNSGLRYVSVFEAHDPDAAEKHGLAIRLEFKHGVGLRGYMLSVHDAVERKLKSNWSGWMVGLSWKLAKGQPHWGLRVTALELRKTEFLNHEYLQHEVGYHLISSTHADGQGQIDEALGKAKRPAAKRKSRA